ncbi:MAG: hypothetical protein WDN69_16675 [Aliidongia sp.]
MVRNAAKLTERIELCLVSVPDRYSPVPAARLEATQGFLDFLQAARGQEWRACDHLGQGADGGPPATGLRSGADAPARASGAAL